MPTPDRRPTPRVPTAVGDIRVLADALPGGRARDVVLATAFATSIAGSRKLSFDLPGSPVPVSAQSLVVLAGGIALGPGRALAATVLHGAIGMAGVKGFAPGHRLARGYAAGLAIAGPAAAWHAARGRARTTRQVAVVAMLGHAVILAAGAAWLRHDGALTTREVWRRGVRPFLPGAAIKSAVAAVVIARTWRTVDAPR